MLRKTINLTNTNHIINKIHSFQKYFIAILPVLQQAISNSTTNSTVTSNSYKEIGFLLTLFEEVPNVDVSLPQANLLLLRMIFRKASERQIKNYNKSEQHIISDVVFKDIKK